jgi:hypothetical protein
MTSDPASIAPEPPEAPRSVLDVFDITLEELSEVVLGNNRVSGYLMGYIAEHKLNKQMKGIDGLTDHGKPADADRKNKGDRVVEYKGQSFKIESKSLQSVSVREDESGDKTASCQCDASDKRPIVLPNGSTVSTVCLAIDEFDILAINLFAFGEGWKFAFIRNRDLPRTKSKKYSAYEQANLLATSVPVKMPLTKPYYDDLQELLDEMAEERRLAGHPLILSSPQSP